MPNLCDFLAPSSQETPPEYDLTKFNVETVLYSGGNDWLADPRDVDRLVKMLPARNVLKHDVLEKWMHLDFIWGMDATSLVYEDIIHSMKKDLKR